MISKPSSDTFSKNYYRKSTKCTKKVFLQGKTSGRLVYNESILSAAQGDISNMQKKCDFREVIYH